MEAEVHELGGAECSPPGAYQDRWGSPEGSWLSFLEVMCRLFVSSVIGHVLSGGDRRTDISVNEWNPVR